MNPSVMGFNPVLHGLRGLAALYVMLYHWNGTFKGLRVQLEQVTIFGEPWHWGFWLQFGWTGVLWFFVLSGYLLTAQMLARPVDMSGANDFWLRRAMRIYPAVWAQLAILLPLVALTGNLKSFSWYQLLGNLGLWFSPFPGAVAPFNAVYWTLPIELLFYLALPLLVWLFRRVNVWVFLALALAFTLSWRLGLYWQGKAGGVVGPQVAWVRDSMPGFFFVFATGMALNRIHLPWSDRARQAAVLLLVRNPEVSTWAVLLCCIYPVWETVYSMYRRQFIDKVNSGQPDMTHLHHLLSLYLTMSCSTNSNQALTY